MSNLSLDISCIITTIYGHIKNKSKMFITIFDQFFIHFGFGFSVALAFGLFARYFRLKRYILHFGGNAPNTLGLKSHWIFWYFVALVIELGTSILTHELYIEMAMSTFQAVAFVAGAFVVDRSFMMFESAEPYPHRTDIVIKPTVVESRVQASSPVVEPASEPIQHALPAPAPSKAWITTKMKSLVGKAARAPKATADTISQSLREQSAERKERQAAREAAEQENTRAAKEERSNRLSDLTDRF